MKTLITTGCSYSQHSFPCWNLWLGEHYKKHISFAVSGSGPKYSYLQIRDYFKYSKDINPKDHHVIIQWSSLLRNDERFNNISNTNRFKHGGQITNNSFYTKEYVKDHFNVIDTSCDLLYYIESLISLSKELGFKLHMLYMFEPWIENFFGEPTSYKNLSLTQDQLNLFNESPYLKSLKELYKSEYFISPSIEKFCFTNEKTSPTYWYDLSLESPYVDHHPSPTQHFNYYKFLAKKLNLSPPPKEWESIVLKLENIMCSKESSKEFIPMWDKTYPYLNCLEYLEYDNFNFNLDYVKDKLKEFNKIKLI